MRTDEFMVRLALLLDTKHRAIPTKLDVWPNFQNFVKRL